MKIHMPYCRYLLLLALAVFSSSSLARDYQIEVVIFETVAGRDLTAGGLYYPKAQSSINLKGDAARQAGFAVVEDGLSLKENAASIASSSRYKLIRHLAWRQPGLDDKAAIPVRVSLGSTSTLYLPDDISDYEDFIPASAAATPERSRQIKTSTVNGTIKVRLGRFLHMEVLLAYTDADTAQSFRLSQSRKMRSRELHYIDNPRFGILTRILPLEDKLLEDPEGGDSPAPQ